MRIEARTTRFAVLSDTHISPAGTADGVWNNATRRSRSGEILKAALAEIVRQGHSTVLMLGDISDDGAPETIHRALSMIAQAGLTAWVVPGNHDTAQHADAIDAAAGPVSACTVLHQAPQQAGHYPLLSQRARLRTAGLRYPGDLLNLHEARRAAERCTGPIVVLHGHLHTAVTRRGGRILQLGCPATVEWPHAWTDLTVDTDSSGARVRVWTRPTRSSALGQQSRYTAPAMPGCRPVRRTTILATRRPAGPCGGRTRPRTPPRRWHCRAA